MRFPRTHLLRRSILSTALLVAPAAATAADQPDNLGLLQGLITGRKATPTEQAAGSTTVQAELQKLFHTEQVQTSQHQVGTITPSYVQQVQHESSDEGTGLLGQLFGGRSLSERRAMRLQERANRMNQPATGQAPSVPKPPPIDYAMQQRQRAASVMAHPAGFSNEITQPPGVPPVGVMPDGRVSMKPAAVDQFVSPFIDDESLERQSVELDLDSLIDRPADRSEAMPITTDGDAVKRLIELPIPLKPPMTDPLMEEYTVTLPSVDEVLEESVDDQLAEVADVTEQAESVIEDSLSSSTVQTEELQAVVIDLDADLNVEEDSNDAEMIVVPSEEAIIEVEEEESETISVDADQAAEVEEKASQAAAVELSLQEVNARRQQQRYLILMRAGRAGFKGFCPVALRETRMLRDSSSEHTARFGLKTYQFSSEAARLKFEADPAHYAPAAGGSDVVLLANTGEETEGSLDFCLWYRDRLYMFRSRETQAIFSSDPARFANQY